MNVTIYPLLGQNEFDSAYSAIKCATDGNLYFGLCTHKQNTQAGLFSFKPQLGEYDKLFNVTTFKGHDTHGKIHTPLIENVDGEMFFGTHFAYPYGMPQPIIYEGGHLLGYHPKGSLNDYGIPKEGEGIISIALDSMRQIIYILTIPSGFFIKYDIKEKTYQTIGQIPSTGGVCRAITIDQKGDVYGSFESCGLFIYDTENKKLQIINNAFPSSTRSEWEDDSRGGANRLSKNIWRGVTYDKVRNCLFGIYGTDSLAFTLDCASKKIEIFGSMHKSKPKSDHSYPTLSLTSDEDTLFFIPSDGLFDYCRSESIEGWSHLLTFSKTTNQILDLGEVSDGDRRVYGVSAATNNDRTLYFIGAVEALKGENYSNFNIINQQPFHLGIIKIEL